MEELMRKTDGLILGIILTVIGIAWHVIAITLPGFIIGTIANYIIKPEINLAVIGALASAASDVIKCASKRKEGRE